jgi:hypothetical protein
LHNAAANRLIALFKDTANLALTLVMLELLRMSGTVVTDAEEIMCVMHVWDYSFHIYMKKFVDIT